MKKIFYATLLLTLVIGCKTNEKSEKSATIDYDKKIAFYRDLAIKSEISDSEADFSKFSPKAQEKLNRRIYDITYINSGNLNDTIYIDGDRTLTILKQLMFVDSLYTAKSNYQDELYNLFFDNQRHAMTVEGVDGNIVTLSDAPGGNAGSMYFEKYLIEGDNVTLISIPETEMTKVEKIVKKKIKNYSHISGRSDMEITPKPDGGYQVQISALTDENGEVSPSIKITFDTKDFKKVDLNSVKAEKS